MRFEYQKRGAVHLHLCLWATPRFPLAGDSLKDPNETVTKLSEMTGGSVNIREGSGFIDYVSGYCAKKQSDGLNFNIVKYESQKQKNPLEAKLGHWLTAYKVVGNARTGIGQIH